MHSRKICLITFTAISLLWTGCSSDDIAPENIREMLDRVNGLRRAGCQCGSVPMPPVQTLTWNDALEVAAGAHASDMYKNNYFNHLSQDGTPPIVRAQQAGYTGNYVGENIARGYTRIEDVINGWIESESHCKAMMDTTYTEMGAARKGNYWVLDLGGSH